MTRRRSLAPLLAAAALLLFAPPSFAQDSLNVSRIAWLSFWDTPPGDAVLLDDSTGLLAAQDAGLHLLDLADPAHIRLVRQIPFADGGSGWRMLRRGDTLHVAGRRPESGHLVVQLYDITDPVNADLIGQDRRFDPFHEGVDGFAVTGATGYLAVEDQLLTVDLSDPSAPDIFAGLTLNVVPGENDMAGLAAWGDTLVVLLPDSGLFTLDMNDPASPTVLDSWAPTVSGPLGAMVQEGRRLVLTHAQGPTLLLELGGDGSLVEQAVLTDYGDMGGAALQGDTLYLGGEGTILKLDITTPASPVVLASWPVETGGRVLDNLRLQGRRLLARFGTSQVVLELDTGTASAPFDLSLGLVERIVADGDLAWAVSPQGGICAVDVSEPGRPRPAGVPAPYPAPMSRVEGVGLRDTILHVTGYHPTEDTLQGLPAIHLFSIADPAHPRRILSLFDDPLSEPLPKMDGLVTPPYFHWMRTTHTVTGLLADPSLLWPHVDMPLPIVLEDEGSVMAGLVNGVGQDSSKLVTYDLADPGIPTAVGQFHLAAPELNLVFDEADRDGDKVATIHAEGPPTSSIWVISLCEISDPTQPTLEQSYTFGQGLNASGVAHTAGHIAVAMKNFGIMLYDFTGSEEPEVAGYFTDPALFTSGGGLEASGGYGFAGAGHSLYIFDLGLPNAAPEPGAEAPRPVTASLGAPWPNPFNSSVAVPFQLARPGRVRISVHDLLGRRVKLLQEGPAPAGSGRAIWRGDTEQRREAASGLYFVRLEAEGRSEVRRVVLVR